MSETVKKLKDLLIVSKIQDELQRELGFKDKVRI